MEQKEEMEQRLILLLFILPPFQFHKTSYYKRTPSRKFPALWRKGSISSWTFLDETKKKWWKRERERERDLHFIMKSFSLYICAHCAPVLIKREACHWKFDAAWSNRETELALVFGRASTSNWITTTQKDGTFSLPFRLFYPSFLLLVLMDALANGNNFPIFSWARACLRSSTTSKVAPTHLLFLELVVSSETRPKCVNKQEGRGEYIQVVNIFTYPRSCCTAFELCTSNECASHCRRMGTRAM